MGQLVDGQWRAENILVNHDDKGLYFKRPSIFRSTIGSEAQSEFPAESGRYHLYCAVACPWAHRPTLMRTKKLEPLVTLTNTFQEPDGEGWSFGGAGHIVPGTDRRVRWLHELYTIADPACTTRVTVPTLWDAKTRRVVNNESSEIIRIFNTAFAGLAEPTPDYYPQALRPEIDATNALVLKGVNNAVNGCGYSISQEAYDSSVKELFATLDGLEQRLSGERYLCGEVETEADWRLFPTWCASIRATTSATSATCAGSTSIEISRTIFATCTRRRASPQSATLTRSQEVSLPPHSPDRGSQRDRGVADCRWPELRVHQPQPCQPNGRLHSEFRPADEIARCAGRSGRCRPETVGKPSLFVSSPASVENRVVIVGAGPFGATMAERASPTRPTFQPSSLTGARISAADDQQTLGGRRGVKRSRVGRI